MPFSVTGLWYRYNDRLEDYLGLRTRDALTRMVDDLLAEERIRLWDVELDRNLLLQDLPLEDYPAVIERFHSVYAELKRKSRWGNVDIVTLDRMDTARAWFPHARFIHIVRDGRDVALSHRKYQYGASNTLECAENWRFKVHANLKMGAMLEPTQYMVIRYEDLVLEPQEELARACRFLDVDYAPEMLGYPAMVDEKIPESRRSLWPLITQGPKSDNAYRWKRSMGTTRRVVFERTASSVLTRLGYETYETLPSKASSLVYELLCFMGKGHRFRRISRLFSAFPRPGGKSEARRK